MTQDKIHILDVYGNDSFLGGYRVLGRRQRAEKRAHEFIAERNARFVVVSEVGYGGRLVNRTRIER